MAVAALVVSIISALTAIAAVLVTYRVHKEQGSLLHCEFKTAYKLSAEEAEKLRGDPSQWGDQYASVVAINKGRSSTTIAGWGFAFLDPYGKPTDKTIVSVKNAEGSPLLPYRLEGESSDSWEMPAEDLNREVSLHKQSDSFHGVVAFIRSGDGRMIYAPEPVRFETES
ncbi:MAG TPA: hypothetical protein VF176_10115 [Solirubrobacterales bacterium]